MPQTIQRSFTGGEIAPAVGSRADLQKYASSLALCQNFFVRAQGGVYSRPGTRYVGEVGQSNRRARLIPFSFNTEQTYILVFEHLKLRFVTGGGFIESGGSPYEIATPYTEDDLPFLDFAQSADVMTITRLGFDPRNLSRITDTNWTLTVNNYAPTVSAPTWGSGTSFAISGITNANPGVVTATGHTFTAGQTVYITGVGGMTEVNNRFFTVANPLVNTFELSGEDTTAYGTYTSGGTAQVPTAIQAVGSGGGSFSKTYRYVVTAVDADGVESLASTEQTATVASLSQTFGLRLSWNAVTGAQYYRVYKDPSEDSGIYGFIGESNTTIFTDYNIAPIISDTPPLDRQPFSDTDGEPQAVGYFQQRQIFANTTAEPQTVFTTQTGNYASLRTSRPSRDDDAITFTLAANQVNEIRHIISLDSLILLTSGAEWIVSEGQDKVLTPATVGTRTQSFNGSSWVRPVVVNSTALFVQEKGARIRDLQYEFTNDKYTGNDLSVFAEHLFEGFEIEEMAYAQEPYSIVWCVRSDGTLLGLTYQREQQVWGWHQHTTDGEFESVAAISEDGRDALYVCVKRTIDGNTVRYVERLEPRYTDAAENAFFVDSGLTYNGAAATVISGLDHLEGEAVVALADGNVVTGLTVSSGSITLPQAASIVHVGLQYTPAIELLDIDVASNDDTLKGVSVSVSKVKIAFEKSRGGWVGPKLDMGGTGEFYEIKPRFVDDSYDEIALRTFLDEVIIDPQWTYTGGVRIEQRAPLPMTILSVIPDVDVGGS